MGPAKRAPQHDARAPRKHKKQRTANRPPSLPSPSPEPHRALGDAPAHARPPRAKDQDELDLEEAVFGRSTAHSGLYDLAEDDLRANAPGHDGFPGEVDYEDDDEVDEETGLERLRDDNLFFVDVPPTASTSAPLDPTRVPLPPSSHASASDSDSDSDADSDAPRPAPSSKPRPSRAVRQAAWHDPADESLQVSLQGQKRLRKLRDAASEDVVSGLEYESRLRRQFEKLHPPPQWATDARRKILRRRAAAAQHGGNAALLFGGDSDASDASDAEGSADERDEADELFSRANVGGSKKRTVKGGRIEPGEIDIDRVRDANQQEQTSSAVVEIGFHPRAQVLFSATSDRRLRLFQIDGTTNPLLQTLHVPELPIQAAAFHPSGSSVLLTGSRPFFLSYDVQTGQTLRSPRGLLHAGLGGSDRASTGGSGGLERFRFSPGTGDVLALAGRRGYVHLVDWGASGVSRGGQVLGEVKMNAPVVGLAWQRDGRELVTLGEDSDVYVWDVGTRKCVERWRDEGGFGARAIETSRDGKWTAVGSSTGIVNLYDDASAGQAGLGAGRRLEGQERKARKAVENLVTPVSTMRFNHDAQLVALASKTNKDQLKLVHLPSCTVFQNWPTQQTPLHHVTSVDFSKGSEWLAVGNQRGKVLLYEVKQFARGSKGRTMRK
ncbi:Utp18p [Rhodotorula paludigena]|uniref:Utp18p n=1 Tax=Rhodotorula paludigena TaxID=86838 RepID=UPI00317D516E